MRHRNSGRRLGRNSSHRKAMYRNMATSLLEHGRIKTTEAKAKELRKVVEKLITLSKRVPQSAIDAAGEQEAAQLKAKRLHAVRQARKWVARRDILQKLFDEYGERYQERPGGYTRIMKIGRRAGDNAPMTLIELIEDEYAPNNDASDLMAATDDIDEPTQSDDTADEAEVEDADADETADETADEDADAGEAAE